MQETLKNTEQTVVYPETRASLPSPNPLVTEGRVNWGSFEQALPDINLLESTNPLGFPVPFILKKMRLKEWQAYQIDSKDFFLLGAVYQTGLCAFNILSLWDKQQQTLTTWQDYAPAWKIDMAKTLLSSDNHLKTRNSEVTIANRLSLHKCMITGNYNQKQSSKPTISFNFELNSCSEPSVMSMPLGANRCLYTHKEIFEASGYLRVGAHEYKCNSGDLAIIDDHKGFYPYKLHYDWVTGFQRTADNSVIAFNLTKNQVLNPESYNENWLWVNGKKYPLPPVHFTHDSQNVWKIKDDYGYVDLEMQIEQNLVIKQQFIIASANYRAAYGRFNGVLKDPSGQSHSLKDVYGMGEDKTYRI